MLGLFVKDQAESGWGVWLGIVGGLADELLCGDTGLTLRASFGTRSSSIPPIHDWSSGSENFLEPHRTVKWKERGADLVIGMPGSLAEDPPCQYAYVLKITGVGKRVSEGATRL